MPTNLILSIILAEWGYLLSFPTRACCGTKAMNHFYPTVACAVTLFTKNQK